MSERREVGGVEATFFANKIGNGIRNARVDSLKDAQETYGLSDTQFEVVKRLAYDEEGNPLDPELRKKLAQAIDTISWHPEEFDLSTMSEGAIVETIYRQMEKNEAAAKARETI